MWYWNFDWLVKTQILFYFFVILVILICFHIIKWEQAVFLIYDCLGDFIGWKPAVPINGAVGTNRKGDIACYKGEIPTDNIKVCNKNALQTWALQ